jgi:DNA-directed RNA polymerase specialized sigma24 family protein
MNQEPAPESDPLLALYLTAPDATAEAQLGALFSLHAGPIIGRILQAKRPNESDLEDVTSAAREHLFRQLGLLRSGERAEPIRDFRSYVAAVAYSAWAEFLRSRQPERAMLLNRLRYLMENRTTQKGFAIWEDNDGAKWCGFANWRGRSGGATPKRQWLLLDPAAAASEAVGRADPAGLVLPSLVAALFRWLGGPIELRDLTNVVAELLGYIRSESIAPHEAVEVEPAPSPAEDLVWKEYLTWLWREIGALSGRQRRAFLLHFDFLRELELLGIASIRAIAGVVDFSPEEFARLWNRLPLDDLSIAKMLDCSRQQVINLRRVARDKLGEAWRQWSAGNNRAESASTSLKA